MRDGDGHLAGAAGTDGQHAALLALEGTGGVGGGDTGEVTGIGGKTHQQDLGDRPAGGQPHQVEAERRGTDQRIGHGRLQGWVRPCWSPTPGGAMRPIGFFTPSQEGDGTTTARSVGSAIGR